VERPVDVVGIEGRRVELPADPLEHVVMLRVPGIVDHVQAMVVAREAADVLRRTRTATSQDHRIPSGWNARDDLLKEDPMLPSIAEVVVVDAPVAGPMKQVSYSSRLLGNALDGKPPRTRSRLGAPEDPEAVHVAVGPAHHDLQSVM
jgi:hypothetical protein